MTLTEYWILLIQDGAQLSEAIPEDDPCWHEPHEGFLYWETVDRRHI